MADQSGIEWTDATWSPVTGCTKVSPGCDHCYMFAMYPRLRRFGTPGYQASPDVVTLLPERLTKPLAWRKPRRVFVNSMSDLWHSAVPDEFVTAIFETMIRADHHQYQILTKRPGRAVGWWERYGAPRFGTWPEHIWIGTSVETQKYAPRCTVLARIPAPIRFVSVEPMLGPVDLTAWLDSLAWIIVGGESGPDARPMDMAWVRDLRETSGDVPFFLKQLGGVRDKRGGDKATLDGRRIVEYPA